jgi:hypothetical protein
MKTPTILTVMKRFGYIWQGQRSASAKRQRDDLVAAGVDPRRIFDMDRGGDRSEREWLVQGKPATLRKGDVVTVACEAYIGAPGRDRRAVLKALAAKGVLVQVLDREPVLYDTPEKIDEFLAEALRVSRADNGRASAKRITDRTGRPPKALMAKDLTEDQLRAILRLWHDANVPWRQVADLLADYTEAAGLPRPKLTMVDLSAPSRFGKRKK